MIGKLILKIVFKATLPLAAMVGISSYMLYMNGGDPMKLLKLATGGMGQQTSELLDSAKQSSEALLSGLPGTGGESSGQENSSSRSIVYRWKAADGSTHFGSVPPADAVEVTRLSVNPDRNVVATRKVAKPAVVEQSSPERLPGAAGMSIPGMDPAAILEAARR